MPYFIRNYSDRKGAGYLINDNRPGGGTLEEYDFHLCSHCQRLIPLHKIEHWCAKCDKAVCDSCASRLVTEGCLPFVKQVEDAMERNYRRSQLVKLLGI
ncbi:MAG: DUF530 domain-containing protein [Steroidobacteraceae bacterium]|nr:DUF530 domain-containing protein [Steroidobacteraceae bacterium]MDW8260847.1 hypothetical protein [Gammaproteobacteria bacterium]